MNEPEQKSKRGEHPHYQRPELKLGLAVILCFVFRMAITSMVEYPFDCLRDIFYPTLALTHDANLSIPMWVGVIAACVWLFRRARHQHAHVGAVVYAGLACAGLLLNSLDSSPFTRLILNNSYEIEGTQYRLIYVVGTGEEIDLYGPVRSFVLFRCEGLGGMMCDTVGTAQISVSEALRLDDTHVDQLELYRDPTHDALMLQLGTEDIWGSPRSFIGCMLR